MITCIIADDELLCIERMQGLLSGFPEIKVVAAEHIPNCAITSIIQHRPDIVFLDIEMPGLSAFDVVEEVRSKNCFPSLSLRPLMNIMHARPSGSQYLITC